VVISLVIPASFPTPHAGARPSPFLFVGCSRESLGYSRESFGYSRESFGSSRAVFDKMQ
jgi:hypothetical protein